MYLADIETVVYENSKTGKRETFLKLKIGVIDIVLKLDDSNVRKLGKGVFQEYGKQELVAVLESIDSGVWPYQHFLVEGSDEYIHLTPNNLNVRELSNYEDDKDAQENK